MTKGDKPLSSKELKVKLSSVWGVAADSWFLTPMGKGFFTINLKSNDLKSRVFSMGIIFLWLGVFRLLQWV